MFKQKSPTFQKAGFFATIGALMASDVLDKLFGSPYRAKLLRLFVANPDTVFDLKTIGKRVGTVPAKVRKDLALLQAIAFVKTKSKNKVNGWQLDTTFPFISHLRTLLTTELLYKRTALMRRFKSVGKLKFLAISGLFIQDPNSRADLVIVGDNLKRPAVDKAVRAIEAEIGHDLKYATFDTTDFLYRYNSSDKFVRDLLDYPHERIINKLAV